jgi:para-nitrobenzyl esterase
MIHRRTLFGAVAGLLTTKAKAQTMTDAPIATTAHGRVRGATDQGIHVFKGIPYGATTAGAARFHAPAPAAGWSGIRDALAYPPMAPQSIFAPGSLFASWTFDKAISEDCLALNVWTPGLRDGAKRPVMVWFHGGDFSSLSGSRNVYDGVRLCRRGDVVVVTVNHRLNAFGYMYLAEAAPQLAAAANPGMLDLVAALRWVHENIAEFGGDPGNVTIFGQSGGGGKVSTIMAMPDATGLFHRAIVQSGSYARNAHLQAMSPEEGTRHARTLLAALEIPPGNTDALASLPMDTLVAAVAKVARGPNRAVWRPIADGTVLPAGPWWPAAPAVSAQVPLMIGTTATEMTMLIGMSDAATFTLDEDGLRRRLADWMKPEDADRLITVSHAGRPEASPSDLFFAIATAISFRAGAWTQAGLKAAQNAAPVYLYELDWQTPVDDGKWHSPHSLDLALVFDNVAKSASMVGTGPDPQRVADRMSSAWIAFARTGDPATPELHWPAWQPDSRATMVFDAESHVVNGFRDDERTLLAGLPSKGPFD